MLSKDLFIFISFFRIGLERHRAEVRRAVSNENLFTIAYKLSGPDCFQEWTIEAKRPIPLLPRDLPLTAYTTLSNSSAQEIRRREKSLPDPSNTRSLQLVPEVLSYSLPAQSSILSPQSIKCDSKKSEANKRKDSNITLQNKRIKPNDLSYNSTVTTNDHHSNKLTKEHKVTRKTPLDIKITNNPCVNSTENSATSSELILKKSVSRPNLHIISIRPDSVIESQVSRNLKSSPDRVYSLHSLRSLKHSSSFDSKSSSQPTTSSCVSVRIMPNFLPSIAKDQKLLLNSSEQFTSQTSCSQGVNDIRVNSSKNNCRASLVSYSMQTKLKKDMTIIASQNSTSNMLQVSTIRSKHPTSNNFLNNTNQKSKIGTSTKSQTSSTE